MNHIDVEIILERKIKYYVYIYIMIIIITILSLITFAILFNYKIYYKVRGIVLSEEDYSIKIIVPLEDIKYITKNDTIIIDKEEYKYKIKEIDRKYITDNKRTYQIIILELNLPNKYKYNNLTLDLRLIKENKKIIKYILRTWKNERIKNRRNERNKWRS